TPTCEQYGLYEGAKRCFEIGWRDQADCYLEAVKPRLAAGLEAGPPSAAAQRAPAALGGPASSSSRATAHAVLAYCFDTTLRLLHPVVPFISEELWQKLPGRAAGELLAVAPWPEPRPQLDEPKAEAQFERVMQVIEKIRAIRADYRVAPKTRLSATLVARGTDEPEAFRSERETIMRLAQLERLSFDGQPTGVGAHAAFGDGSEVFVALGAGANMAAPPGGPPDSLPPRILVVHPESGAVVRDLSGAAVIQFDEVIDEMAGSAAAGAGTVGGIGRQVILSPVAGDVDVSWHRKSIHVKPSE